MVLQVGTNPRQLRRHGDAVYREQAPWPDAGELQDLRRSHRAGADDHLVRSAQLDVAATLAIADAHHLPALPQEASDVGTGRRSEIATPTGAREIGDGRAAAATAAHRHLE